MVYTNTISWWLKKIFGFIIISIIIITININTTPFRCAAALSSSFNYCYKFPWQIKLYSSFQYLYGLWFCLFVYLFYCCMSACVSSIVMNLHFQFHIGQINFTYRINEHVTGEKYVKPTEPFHLRLMFFHCIAHHRRLLPAQNTPVRKRVRKMLFDHALISWTNCRLSLLGKFVTYQYLDIKHVQIISKIDKYLRRMLIESNVKNLQSEVKEERNLY